MNPTMNILVIFTGQVGFRNTSRLHLFDALTLYPKIQFYRIDVFSYYDDTPLNDWIKSMAVLQSRYYKEHLSDSLRYTRYSDKFFHAIIYQVKPSDFDSKFDNF